MQTQLNEHDHRTLVGLMRRFFPLTTMHMREDVSQEAALALIETQGDFKKALRIVPQRIQGLMPQEYSTKPTTRPRLATCRTLSDVCELYGFTGYDEQDLQVRFRRHPQKRKAILRAVLSGEKPVEVARRMGLNVSDIGKHAKMAVTRLVKELDNLPRYWKIHPGALKGRGQGAVRRPDDRRLASRRAA